VLLALKIMDKIHGGIRVFFATEGKMAEFFSERSAISREQSAMSSGRSANGKTGTRRLAGALVLSAVFRQKPL